MFLSPEDVVEDVGILGDVSALSRASGLTSSSLASPPRLRPAPARVVCGPASGCADLLRLVPLYGAFLQRSLSCIPLRPSSG